MSEPVSIYPYEIAVPGLGLCTVLDPEGVTGYRVQMPGNGGIQAFSAIGEPSPEAAAADIAFAISRQNIATPAIIAEWRYRVENGGVTVAIGGVPHRFDTTRENRAMWLALRLEAEANPALEQGWKTLAGVFVSLSAADILTVCAAVYGHVAACFALEEQLLANPPEILELPNAGWPA